MIRPARAEDAEAIGDMHAASWAETYPGLVPEGLLAEMSDRGRRRLAWARILAAPALPGGVLVAGMAGTVAGFVSVAPVRDRKLGTDGEVTGIYLLRHAQGRGIGAALLAAGFGVLRAGGHRSAGAWAVQGNRPAERFYAARGGVPGPERTEHRGPHAIRETGWVWDDLSRWP